MPYTTFTELKAAIADEAHRTDLTTPIIDFVTSAEWTIARDLRVSPLITRGTITIAPASLSVALPNATPFLGMVSARTAASKLIYLTPDKYDDAVLNANSITTPTGYSLIGANFHIAPAWSGGGDVTINYFRKEPALSVSVSSNWYLANAPDLMMAASMVHLAAYLKDFDLLSYWKTKYEFIRDRINADHGGVVDAVMRAQSIAAGRGKANTPSL
jgi:hypothetical protein